MSTITVTAPSVLIELTRFEKIVGLLGDQHVPVAAITAAVVEPDPLRGMRGLRAPGLALPGRTKIGTWRGDGRRQFVVARRGHPAVRIDVKGLRYDTFLISVPDTQATVSAIRSAIGSATEPGRGPEGP